MSTPQVCVIHGATGTGPFATYTPVKDGPTAYICAECVMHAYVALKEEGGLRHFGVQAPLNVKQIHSVAPRAVKEILDTKIIGQDKAKIALATAFSKHVERMKDKAKLQKKFNLFIFGPTGTGKTEMISTLAANASLPFVDVDASQITPAGYKGDSVEDFLRRLYMAANQNIELAQNGIVYLDELDKMVRANGFEGSFGNDIQKSLLKCIEGGDFEIRLSPQHPPVNISTRDMMFVGSGAFVGLSDLVGVQKSVGISGVIEIPKDDDWQEKIGPDQLIKYGLMPEFVGRFSSYSYTKALTLEQIKQILTTPEGNAVQYFVNLFQKANSHLILSDEFLTSIAEKAMKDQTGVRSIQKHLSDTIDPIFFNIDKLVNRIVTVAGDGSHKVQTIEESGLLLNYQAVV